MAEADFFRWAKTKSIGCMFARAMFSDTSHYKIKVKTLAAGTRASEIAEEIATAVASPDAEGLVLLVPAVTTTEQMAALLRDLRSVPGWLARETEVEWLGQVYVVLGLDVPVGNEAGAPVLSELVAFGPMEYVPETRRSPVTAITLRTKPTNSLEPLPDRDERRANLAAIPIDVPARTFDQLWKMSEDLKSALVGKGNPLVRARVTFPVPKSNWDAAVSEGQPGSSRG